MSSGMLLLQHIDGRTREARRFRDICLRLGLTPATPEEARARIRAAASLILRSEQIQTDQMSGKCVDPAKLAKLTSERGRALEQLAAA
jgi:hypothetical protein